METVIYFAVGLIWFFSFSVCFAIVAALVTGIVYFLFGQKWVKKLGVAVGATMYAVALSFFAVGLIFVAIDMGKETMRILDIQNPYETAERRGGGVGGMSTTIK